jgi:hypothetical protein
MDPLGGRGAALLGSILLVNPAQSSTMKIRMTIQGNAITATLADNDTAWDFASLLRLTLTMNDLFSREKFGHLPRALPEGGERVRSYAIGQLIYWSPGPDVAMFYRDDGQAIPSPEGSVEPLRVPGPVTVTFEAIEGP